MDKLDAKFLLLKANLARLKPLLIAYSGGIDSALLLKVAYDVMGTEVLAVTADSPSVPRRELAEAAQIAQQIGARHTIIPTRELENERYRQNPWNRCYFCKGELYSALSALAQARGIPFIANGTNLDDIGDVRPGRKAAEEFQVTTPLKDAGLTKAEIRELAKGLGLDPWDKPASPCLSSRIPYGTTVSVRKLAMVEAAEAFLRELNIRELRVRHFGRKARIEANPNDLSILKKERDLIRDRFKNIGFDEIEFHEFRSGSLNELVNLT